MSEAEGRETSLKDSSVGPGRQATALEGESSLGGGGAGDPPTTVIRPQVGWRGIHFKELWQYRELLYFLTWRDIKVRYKQTVLGATWAILQPVLTMVVLTVFFGRFGGMDRQTEYPYPIFVYCALVPWQFFATSVTQASQSLVSGANLINKVYFPRLIVPVAAVGGAAVDLLISLLVFGVLMAWYGVGISGQIVFFPFFLVATVMVSVGTGTLVGALTVAYRDFRYAVPFMIQVWFFACPVAYPIERIPEQWRMLYAVNPMAGVTAGLRASVLGQPIAVAPIVVSAGSTLVLVVLGLFYFRRVEARFADIA